MARINHSATLGIGGEVLKSWASSVAKVTRGSDSMKKHVASLKKSQRGVATELRRTEDAASAMGVGGSKAVAKLTREHVQLKGQQKAVDAELRKAQRAAAKLGKDGSKDVDRLLDKSQALAAKERKLSRAIDDTRRAHGRMAVEGSSGVRKLRSEHERLDRQLKRESHRLKRMQAWANIDVRGRVGRSLRGLGTNLAAVGRRATFAAGALATMGLGGAAWFTKSLVTTNARFETIRATLETIEGSSAKAGKSLGWIAKFGANTPYEIGQVSDAFVKLRTYGIDPTDGTLRTLGDTASAMGKDLNDAVEAIADAMTGENERLKEFGIKARTQGKKVTYSWNQDGKQMRKTVAKNNQAAIQSTLLAIWNDRYGGAMKKRVSTWEGMWSNLADQWTFFQLKIGQAGVFDLMKEKLSSTLEAVARWSQDGTLERWAQKIADAYSWAFDRVSEGFVYVRDNWPEIKRSFGEFWETSKQVASGLATVAGTLFKVGKWASKAVGGADNLAVGLAALGAAKVLSPLWGLVTVGKDVVSWLVTGRREAAALEATLGGGSLKSLIGKAGGMRGLAAMAGKGLGVAAAGYVGYEATSRLLKATGGDEKLEGFGAWLHKKISGGDDSGIPRYSPSEYRAANRTIETSNTSQVTNNVTIHAPGTSREDVEDAVDQVLGSGMRSRELASHG